MYPSGLSPQLVEKKFEMLLFEGMTSSQGSIETTELSRFRLL